MDRLYKELEKYSQKDDYPFHMPGHKRNSYSVDGKFPFDRDITEIEGFDNLHHPEGIIKDAQKAAADLYGSLECFFSINGSTAALLAAISSCVKKGGQILMARNCHKAVYHAVYLRELKPVYIYPHIEHELGINGGITPSRIKRVLEANSGIEAIIITSPTYDGVVSDIAGIARIAKEYNIPLIVDEAHGAHFRFSDYFPVSAVELGADIVVQSLHKTLPSMTQTAVLHRCSDRVSGDAIRRFMGIYQSSSPSYILMASMDACIDKMARDGESMFLDFTDNLKKVRERLEKCRNIRLGTADMIGNAGIFDFDRSKLLFFTKGTSLTGRKLHEILRREFHLQMEMESEHYVIAITSVGDTEEGLHRLCDAIEEIDRRQSLKIKEEENDIFQEISPYMQMKQMMGIAEAMESPLKRCPLEESIGKISAEFVYLYPPGIPILVPGEQITGQFVRNVRRYMEQGLDVQGLSDYSNKTICIVGE
ncbi:MAG: aminotransferase class I/II-fold pyridoxal phosphate-dependent enzyme [Eubacteriales bacterium]|nr:aminotransferase class I/II-fold pyridoxal phosphate-dependent enzyme [Eubacteriales bacterium]